MPQLADRRSARRVSRGVRSRRFDAVGSVADLNDDRSDGGSDSNRTALGRARSGRGGMFMRSGGVFDAGGRCMGARRQQRRGCGPRGSHTLSNSRGVLGRGDGASANDPTTIDGIREVRSRGCEQGRMLDVGVAIQFLEHQFWKTTVQWHAARAIETTQLEPVSFCGRPVSVRLADSIRWCAGMCASYAPNGASMCGGSFGVNIRGT